MQPLHARLYDESVPASIEEVQVTQQEMPHRVERDSMGEVKVPREALFGAQTRRALDNFPVSDLRFQRRFIQALGAIKLESANVNNEDRKSTRLNSSHANISYAVFCLKN